MASSRIIEFRLNGDYSDSYRANYIDISLNTYLLLLVYACKVNATKAKLFYAATQTGYRYRKEHNLPLGILTFEDEWVYLPLNELQQVVDFITNEILPDLQLKINANPDQLIVQDWLGTNDLDTFLLNLGGFFDSFDPDRPDYLEYLDIVPIDFFNQFKGFNKFFKDAILKNFRYTIVIS